MKSVQQIPNTVLLFTFAFLGLVVQCEKLNPKPKPEIESKWQVSSSSGWYLEGQDFHPGVSFQNNNEDLILTSSVSSLILICSAHYPVYWTYHFLNGVWKSVPSIDLHRTSEEFKDPHTYKYYSYLTMTGTSGLGTGTFICRSTSQDAVQASRFIFWEGATNRLVFGEGRRPSSLSYYVPYVCTTPSCKGIPSRTVRADKNNQTITLPCAVNSPQAKILLYKRPEDRVANASLDYREIDWTNTSGITFDPKVGFIFKMEEMNVNGSSVYGIYKCTPADPLITNMEETGSERTVSTELLILNVTTGVEMDSQKTENDTLTGKAKYSFDTSAHEKFGDRIVCCSNGTKPPRIYKASCSTKYACTTLRKQLQDFRHFDESDIRRGNCRSSVVGPLYRSLYSPIIGVFRCFGDGIDVTREFYIPPDKLLGSQNSNESVIYYDRGISGLNMSGLITFSCDTDGDVVGSVLFAYTNHSVTLTCHSSNYLFVYGVRWSIVWVNKTTQLLPEKGGYVIGDSIRTELRNELKVMPRKDIHSVICHAPLYDSSQWVNQSLRFNVSDSEKPKIKGPGVERLNWVIGERGKELTCEGTGVPLPTYSWTEPMTYESYFDQYTYTYKVSANWSEYSSNRNKVYGERNVTLTFKQVIPSMGGQYVCTASNLGGTGTATKTFILALSETPGSGEVSSSSSTPKPPRSSTNSPTHQTPLTSTSTSVSDVKTKKTNTSPTPEQPSSGSETKTSHSDRSKESGGGGVDTGTLILVCLSSVVVIGVLIGGGVLWKRRMRLRGEGRESDDERSESDGVSYQDLRSFNALT